MTCTRICIIHETNSFQGGNIGGNLFLTAQRRGGAREVDAAALRRPRSRLAHRAARASDYDGVVAEGLGQCSRSCSTMVGDGGWPCNGVSRGAVVCCIARGLQA